MVKWKRKQETWTRSFKEEKGQEETGDEETTVIRRQGGTGKGMYGRQWVTVGGCGGGGEGI